MNVESLKSELQQVLDSDVVLRKEFNEMKRSLSDYRNQLIMRDEDCKRLQVTIDVLNTKLVVMERDNTNFKGELSSFKELRGTIREQLDNKQLEIDARLEEILQLRNELNVMAADYEEKIEAIRNEASSELEKVKEEYTAQITELKTNTYYKETGIREEFENRLSELSIALADQEQGLTLNHEEAVMALKSAHASELSDLTNSFESRLSRQSSSSGQDLESMKAEHARVITVMETELSQKMNGLEMQYTTEIFSLTLELQTQREKLTADFNAQLEHLNQEFAAHERGLIAGYEQQLEELRALSSSASGDMTLSFQNQVGELKSSYEETILQKDQRYVAQIRTLSEKYEDRLSNTLIHSTSQNSRLNEELSKVQLENDHFKEKIRELVIHIDSQNSDIEHLSLQLTNFQLQLKNEGQRFSELSSEFELFKQNALLSGSEQVNGLSLQIEGLNGEVSNMAQLLETTTNALSETELSLELKVQELENASLQIDGLNARIDSFASAFSEKENELTQLRAETEISTQQQLDAKEVEYQKLLFENATIINEMDMAQDKVEAYEAELALLKTELNDLKLQTAGKVEHFKETLSERNFEITSLEANNAGLCQELLLVKLEMTRLEEQAKAADYQADTITALQQSIEMLNLEKNGFTLEISHLQETINGLEEQVSGLSANVLAQGSADASPLVSNTADQDDFIDRLFKQIDVLNDQRMSLLDEKEQMAGQLLKMNDVLGSLSQHVESERIDVTDLNNHRKNVILAKNSGETGDRSHMKQQINELVREIDKCIALLSA